ncbi:MAG: ATP-binding cassette domain-containing protein, partial [Pseudobdellovibrionaceae bacterium]
MATVVEIRNISKAYQLGSVKVQAIKGLSLSLQEGEFTALIGSSGSGKTTLLNLIGCLDDADQGEILIDQVNVRSLSEDQK